MFSTSASCNVEDITEVLNTTSEAVSALPSYSGICILVSFERKAEYLGDGCLSVLSLELGTNPIRSCGVMLSFTRDGKVPLSLVITCELLSDPESVTLVPKLGTFVRILASVFNDGTNSDGCVGSASCLVAINRSFATGDGLTIGIVVTIVCLVEIIVL